MIKLRALRSLAGDYGRVHAGALIEVDGETALRLEGAGFAERYYEPAAPAVAGILAGIRSKMQSAPENKRTKKSKTAEPDKTAPGRFTI